jgi:hypothetical protein
VLFNPRADIDRDGMRSFAQSLSDLFRSDDSIDRVSVGHRLVFDAGYQRLFGDATYQYAAILEFRDEDRLGAYLRSAAHAEIGRLFWELCDSCVVSEHLMIDGRSGDLLALLGAD